MESTHAQWIDFRVAVPHLLNFLVADSSKFDVCRSSGKMSDEEDDDFVTFGTPLPEYADGKAFFTNLSTCGVVIIVALLHLKHDSIDEILKKFGRHGDNTVFCICEWTEHPSANARNLCNIDFLNCRRSANQSNSVQRTSSERCQG